MDHVSDYKEKVIRELNEIPDEFIPFILEQVKAYKGNLKARKNNKQSPTKRLINLAGALENPEGLNAKQYKKKIVEEYLSHRL